MAKGDAVMAKKKVARKTPQSGARQSTFDTIAGLAGDADNRRPSSGLDCSRHRDAA
jgi:hypothetical protein